jgi:glutamine synthetase
MKFCAAVLVLLSAVGASAFLPSASFDRRTCLKLSNGILPKVTGRSSLDPAVTDRYNALPFPDDKILAEYVWVDADGNCRSKTRTLPKKKVLVTPILSCSTSTPTIIFLSLTHCNS